MTPHNNAQVGEIAETVLLPCDPLRAQFIAETFLTDVKQYNTVRNMFGFTGFYKDKKVSVQGSGMGIPSIGIYAHELINTYGCKRLIRVGSAGSLQEKIQLGSIVLAQSASTDSSKNFLRLGSSNLTFAPSATFSLLQQAYMNAIEKEINPLVGNVFSSDVFYDENDLWKKFAKYGTLCVEMETSELYTLGAQYNIEVLSILTMSDNLPLGEHLSAEEREKGFSEMAKLALSLV